MAYFLKSQRQRRIINLIRQQPVTSQNQLVKLLRAAGYPSTQATVSRDLEELGVAKIRREGKVAYALPSQEGPAPSESSLKRILSEFVLELESTGNLVVLKTPPGHAGVVASALDRSSVEGIAGTIAGDDTVFIACKQGTVPRRVERRLTQLIETRLEQVAQ